MALVECKLVKIVMSESHDRQVIILQEKDGHRSLPILVGPYEIYAIHRTVNNEPPPRPLTHELVGSILAAMDISIERVIVSDLRNMTFYARLFLKQDGKTYEIDSRPSDAIALALQVGAPMYVEEKVLEEAASDSD